MRIGSISRFDCRQSSSRLLAAGIAVASKDYGIRPPNVIAINNRRKTHKLLISQFLTYMSDIEFSVGRANEISLDPNRPDPSYYRHERHKMPQGDGHAPKAHRILRGKAPRLPAEPSQHPGMKLILRTEWAVETGAGI
jgi:hypothetical protein